MSTPYLHQAIANGGKLFVRPLIPNKLVLSAHVSFPSGRVVKGEITMTVVGAIEKLEEKLKKEAEAS